MSSADAAAYGAHTGDAEAGKLLDGVHKEAVELESRLADHRVPSVSSISRIKAEFLIQLDVPFGFGGMTARWTPSGLI